MVRKTRLVWAASAIAAATPMLWYSAMQWQRPSRISVPQAELFEGITYERQIQNQPWPQVIHVVEIDLTQPNLKVLTSPGNPGDDGLETIAQTTSDFVVRNNLHLAVNANFFYPFDEKTPWNFYPRTGDRTNVLGIAVANGEGYSPPETEWPALCFDAANRAEVTAVDGICPPGTQQAISGIQHLLWAGRPVPIETEDRAYARVMAAVDEKGDRLWLVVVDGKQPNYSEGATLAQLTEIALSLGADAAINLDGGGSTTLVRDTADGPVLLNAPVHTKLPMRERPVANHLGFRIAD
ncbi:phosphodiester glycosidase family protein [Oscillatoria sp. CS-180]|uniref:phosphodiester glycosidase family protein n=1 Tax=Oscillatoria sp. CS-180 TaxID=3021720 RepID=UPI00232D144B|nr:phosphodiester glycosidase family protein [Oscillatoria sp. CS-180]MDB9526180.1 phosphodiester glycosidase family protein [Oscillatoria sp. CS-180]